MRRRGTALVAAAGLVTALAACGGSGSEQSPVGNPLTGQGDRPSGPVVGIKVDDTEPARPQFGLNGADVVYVEMAEGGATRLVALYASHRPDAVGPVRSVRTSDPELLAPFGPMALGFSGGASGVLAHFARSPLVDASSAAHPGAYHRDSSRRAPHNLLVNVHTLSGQVGGAAGVRDVGFAWAKDSGHDSAPGVDRFSVLMGNTRVGFAWDSPAGRWVRQQGDQAMTGADGAPITARNVLVQFCRVTPDTSDIDQAGNPAQFTHAVGNGRAVLFRDGRMIEGNWERKKADEPTHYTDRDGTELRLRPGGVWVLLAPTGSPLDTG